MPWPYAASGGRDAANDNRLLSSFVHEQLHWILLARVRQALAAMAELQAVFPEVPVGYPEGAVDRSSTYLHATRPNDGAEPDDVFVGLRP